MTPPLRLPHPEDLVLPLRDLMRGAQQVARLPIALARPAVSRMPGPLRGALSDIGKRAEAVYRDSLEIWRPTVIEIRQAAAQLNDRQHAQLAVMGRVVAWAMEIALGREDGPEFFISETVVSLALETALARASADQTASTRAAHAVFALVEHGLGPSAQEFPFARMTPERAARLRVAAVAAMLFLLAERSEDTDGEVRILSYAITIARLVAADIEAAQRDTAATADLLRRHAEII